MKVTIERSLQWFQILMTVFVVAYLLTYVQHQRSVLECQSNVDKAQITSIDAGREAAEIQNQAMTNLLNGLLSPSPDARALLEAYRSERERADVIRQDNPLPNPDCS